MSLQRAMTLEPEPRAAPHQLRKGRVLPGLGRARSLRVLALLVRPLERVARGALPTSALPRSSRADTSQYTHPVGTVAGSGCPRACTSSSSSASVQLAASSRVDGSNRTAERGSAAHASDGAAASKTREME